MTAPAYDKVLLHKAKVIERCVARARQEFDAAQGHFSTDFTRQDAAVLNLQRACEAALDMAQRVISLQGWGIAETSKELFAVLQRKSVISSALAKTLTNMVGFRNLAVHDYEELNYDIVESIITKDCTDLLLFSEQMVKQFFNLNRT
jgi:uncharacterized protein YutE (UPF0331/DUF86 family)